MMTINLSMNVACTIGLLRISKFQKIKVKGIDNLGKGEWERFGLDFSSLMECIKSCLMNDYLDIRIFNTVVK